MIPIRLWRPTLHTTRFSGQCQSCKLQASIWSWYVALMCDCKDPLMRREYILGGQVAVVAIYIGRCGSGLSDL